MQDVSLDFEQCSKTALTIRSLKFNSSFYKREFLTFDADRETKLRVYLFSAAICHQTHNLHHPGLNLQGWDYLEYGMIRMVESGRALLNPGYVSMCKPEDIEEQLSLAFSPEGDPAKTSLDRMDERIRMLQELCLSIHKDYNNRVNHLVDRAKGMLSRDNKGLYELLTPFEAFSDPYHKKITFFIKLATDAGVLRINDAENFVPIMDYHMQRVLLRLGCVRVRNPRFRDDLKNRVPQKDDHEVRAACIEALRFIAEQAGLPILKMNDIFWPVGRSCCGKTTLCSDGFCLKSPCTTSKTLILKSHAKCLFQDFCLGSQDQSYRNLWEPQVQTHFY
jgi:hypothetical protein